MLFRFFVISAFVFSAFLVLASSSEVSERDLPLAQVITSCSQPNTAALTFDDGPWTYNTDIVNTLTAAGVKGTFFFSGQLYGCIYDAASQQSIKTAYAAGHQIAAHTWAHKHLATLSSDEINSEMSRVEEALERIVGVTPAFTRPPYGESNDLVRQIAYNRGQSLVIWDFDANDWNGYTAAQTNALYDQAVAKHPSSILTLNHEPYEQTAHAVLPHAISVLKAAGYDLVTVAECMGMSPYLNIGTPQNGTWTC